jgi:hypothetical protein
MLLNLRKIMKRNIYLLSFAAANLFMMVSYLNAHAQMNQATEYRGRPFVNQAGYNLNEAKRFTCPGAPDGTPFSIFESTNPNAVVYTGKINRQVGDFTNFNPISSTQEYIIEVNGFGQSVPFWIADHLMEKISSRLAYQFFIDVRGGFMSSVLPSNITGGGPSRDGGGQGLEATFEGLLYASNPALYDRWNKELRLYGNDRMYPVIPPPDTEPDSDLSEYFERHNADWRKKPDLIKLLLWHSEFAYNHRAFKGEAGGGYETMINYRNVREFGYEGKPLQGFDYQNMLDQLAATLAFYHSFLKPYLPEETYQKYRKACLNDWERYDRHKEVRYWVKSSKWIDEGYKEFNEQGSAYGQGLLRNLMMYAAEKNEKNGQADKFLKYAQGCALDIIKNWNFNNEWHTWAMRNAEHITPQALALFMMIAPDKCPAGTREKLKAWRDYIVRRTDNLWNYRTHNDVEWAHRKSKEVGTVAGLGGSMFAVANVLNDSLLRSIGWSQVNYVFGLNPAGAHLSNKSGARTALGGYWDGVEKGWPYAYIHGTGELGYTRGALDGSPTNHAFPFKPDSAALGDSPGLYGTEGWAISNRGWMATIAFSTTGSHHLSVTDEAGKRIEKTSIGKKVMVELKAALNQDWNAKDTGWVLVQDGDNAVQKITVTETGAKTGIFKGEYIIKSKKGVIQFSYGYLGFEKNVTLIIK